LNFRSMFRTRMRTLSRKRTQRFFSNFKSSRQRRDLSGADSSVKKQGPCSFLAARNWVCALAFGLLAFSSLRSQDYTGPPVPPEKIIHPHTSLCLLNPRGAAVFPPFDMNVFRTELLAYLRSSDYLTVKPEEEVAEILARHRVSVPDTYETDILTRICRLTECDYTAFFRMIGFEIDLHDGFSIPVLFHRNKVTYRAELDLAVVEGKTGTLYFSEKIRGKKGVGRGIQIFPVTEDPAYYSLDFRQKEALARQAMQDLARQTFEPLIKGIHRPLGVRYVCYWQDEIHVISDKPGLCPICGSRLVKKYIW